jgi:hypothetical protein
LRAGVRAIDHPEPEETLPELGAVAYRLKSAQQPGGSRTTQRLDAVSEYAQMRIQAQRPPDPSSTKATVKPPPVPSDPSDR